VQGVRRGLLVFLCLPALIFCRPAKAAAERAGAGAAVEGLGPPAGPGATVPLHETAPAPFLLPRLPPVDDPIPEPRWSLWMGGAIQTGGLIGKIDDVRLGLLALRYERTFVPARAPPTAIALSYTADVVPVASLTVPAEARPRVRSSTGRILQLPALRTRGLGIAPFGLRLRFWPDARVQPFVSGSAGFLYFDTSIPDGRGKQFNFTADAGVGVEVRLAGPVFLTTGYRYHHLSNGYRGEVNPGIDSHLFTAGLTLSL
jgi:hypothetical protein